MRNTCTSIVIAAAGVILLAGCGKQPDSAGALDRTRLKVFAPLPETVPVKAGGLVEERIALGRMLYYDPRLSKSQTISCNSCHKLSAWGVDGEPTSAGFKGQRGDRNSPTVYNAAGHFVQFWDGRAADVEEQAKGPVLNPVEMAMPSEKVVVATLRSIPDYVVAFQRAFPGEKDPVTYQNMANAIGTFERRLLTPARWDRFLGGDDAALTSDELAGLHTFLNAGCQTCHAGAFMGGHIYQKLGLVKDYPDTADPGRFKVTRSESDRMMFKVPSLRNIEKTGPYFHNGKVAVLDAAVTQMADYQLGGQLSEAEVRSIVTFLKALTGEIPADYIKEPALPKSTDKTPKPAPAD